MGTENGGWDIGFILGFISKGRGSFLIRNLDFKGEFRVEVRSSDRGVWRNRRMFLESGRRGYCFRGVG